MTRRGPVPVSCGMSDRGPSRPDADAGRPGPVLLRPSFVRRLWGGDALPAWLGEAPPPGDEPVAEAWLAHGGSEIATGPWAGRTVAEWIRRHGADVIGSASLARYGPTMPLLAKFLDAADDLSVQVHPNDAAAAARHPGSGHLGKTESWRVVHAAPGARVVWGLREPVPEERLRRAAREGTIGTLLRTVPVATGQAVHNPAGTIHAVGAGLLLYELQQASDLTYRLWDYGRHGADGTPRALHLDDALAVADRSGAGDPLVPPRSGPDGWTVRVACPFYRLEERRLNVGDDPVRCATRDGKDGSGELHLITIVDGHATLTAEAGRDPLALTEGATVLVPASAGRYRLEGSGTALRGRTTAAG